MNRAENQNFELRFRRGWYVLCVVELILLAVGLALVRHYQDLRSGAFWAIKVAAFMIYQQLFLLCNRKRILSGDNLRHLWGPANLLSLSRGLLISMLAGFLFTEKPPGLVGWLPALLYTVAATLDFLDGYWARRSNTQTRLGELLDQEYDAQGILVAVVLVIQWGHLPVPFLYIGLARYAFAAGIAWRRRRRQPVYPLPPSYLRRRLAGFHMGILAVFLWPIARAPGTVLAELIIGVPLLVGFIRDWLLISGALDPQDPDYKRMIRTFYRMTRTRLSLLARACLLFAAVPIILNSFGPGAPPAPWITATSAWTEPLGTAFTALQLILLLLLLGGRFTSAGSLLLLLQEGLRIFSSRLDPWGAAIISATLLLYLFGPGPYTFRLRRSLKGETPAGGS
jgi:CDP-diacylglycerol--glycerol-3-phosphate 3-phosphatidyltransferase